jgi:hypothetical protein
MSSCGVGGVWGTGMGRGLGIVAAAHPGSALGATGGGGAVGGGGAEGRVAGAAGSGAGARESTGEGSGAFGAESWSMTKARPRAPRTTRLVTSHQGRREGTALSRSRPHRHCSTPGGTWRRQSGQTRQAGIQASSVRGQDVSRGSHSIALPSAGPANAFTSGEGSSAARPVGFRAWRPAAAPKPQRVLETRSIPVLEPRPHLRERGPQAPADEDGVVLLGHAPRLEVPRGLLD